MNGANQPHENSKEQNNQQQSHTLHEQINSTFNQQSPYHSQNTEQEQDQQISLEEAEQRHFMDILLTFFNYQNDSIKDVLKMHIDFQRLGEDQKYLHFDYSARINKMYESIQSNYDLLMTICYQYQDQVSKQLNIELQPDQKHLTIPNLPVEFKNISKLRSTLKQFVRDWSIEGQKERDDCYKPCIEEVQKYFPEPLNKETGKRIKVLLPGAGLGRLVFDFAKLGYAAQGNEFSYFMLICSDFILNQCDKANQFEVQPYIHTFINNYNENDAFQKISIPDLYPYDFINPENCEFSMVAGEFIEVYKSQITQWDSIVTCFFIDTANNIIAYLKVIHNILKKGGVWVNFGPLLYHYAEMQGEMSIELSWEELEIIIPKMGFEIKNKEFRKCTYASREKSMMQVVYDCIFFTAIKTSDNIL